MQRSASDRCARISRQGSGYAAPLARNGEGMSTTGTMGCRVGGKLVRELISRRAESQHGTGTRGGGHRRVGSKRRDLDRPYLDTMGCRLKTHRPENNISGLQIPALERGREAAATVIVDRSAGARQRRQDIDISASEDHSNVTAAKEYHLGTANLCTTARMRSSCHCNRLSQRRNPT